MESGDQTDHAAADDVADLNDVVNDDDVSTETLPKVIKLNDLNDVTDHDPLCMEDVNSNGRDLNGAETAADEVDSISIDESKQNEEKDNILKETDIEIDKDTGGDAVIDNDETVENMANEKTETDGNKSTNDSKFESDSDLNGGDVVNEKSDNNHDENRNDSKIESGDDGDSEAKLNENMDVDVDSQGSEKVSDGTEQDSMDAGGNDESTAETGGNDESTADADSDDGDETVEMESHIKSGDGNGIIMSLTRKPGKRKAGDTFISRSKYRKLIGEGLISTRKSPRMKSLNNYATLDSGSVIDEIIENNDKQVGTSEIDQIEKEHSYTPTSQSVGGNLPCLDSSLVATPTNKDPVRRHLTMKGRKSSPAQSKALTPQELEKYSAPFNHGWRRELVYRGTSCENVAKTQADTYYFSPNGPKLRSMVQIADWLSSHNTPLTTDNFTFMRRPIGVEGESIRNASQSRGRANVESVLKKRHKKQVKEKDNVHDDNDGQYDKPEIVIERDSDDYIGQIMSIVNEKSVVTSVKSGLPNLEELKPNLEELKKELKKPKIEPKDDFPASSSPVMNIKKKVTPKSTARKSTTQKTFKKSVSLTGAENLCSINCPGLQGIPPMLTCTVCMCLFHEECVNFFGQSSDFICLRCKDMGSPSTTSSAANILQSSNPNLLKHLITDQSSLGTPSMFGITSPITQFGSNRASPVTHTIYRAFPNGDMVKQVDVLKSGRHSASPGAIILRPLGADGVKSPKPMSTTPLFKSLPMSSISPSPTSTTSFPVLLTPNPSFISSSSSALFPVSIAAVNSNVTVSKSSTTPVTSSINSVTDYPEIRPLIKIKEEPIDDSYEQEQKTEKIQQASSEALCNLKSVLSSRIGDSNIEKIRQDLWLDNKKQPQTSTATPQAHNATPVSLKSSKSNRNNVSMLGNSMLGNLYTPPQYNAMIGSNMSGFVAQPRMSLNNTSLPQYGANSGGYRLVPVGPPVPIGGPQVPIGGMQVPMPIISSPGLVRLTSPTMAPMSMSQNHTRIEAKKTVLSSPVVVSSQSMASSNTGPLIVNANSITPQNGQMLTLPPVVVKKLTLNKSLALKINNKQIDVPPSGFFHTDDGGLKVFLPPNTFPTAEDSTEASVVSVKDKEKNKSDSPKDKQKDSNSPEKKRDSDSVVKLDITKNKFYNKCCLMHRLYHSYECMEHIFQYLTLKELLNMRQVCKTWRRIVQLPDLWKSIRLKDMKINDWEAALKFISERNVQSVSLLGVCHFEDPNRTWHQLLSSVHLLSSVRKISFCNIPAMVLQSIVGKLTQLESLCAEMVTDYIDDTMWDVPSKLDVGNFCLLSELTELKLRGPGGLNLPSFNFGCRLSDLGKLSKLKTLHLTSFRNISSSEFKFLSSLHDVEDLKIGDCDKWTEETYIYLTGMSSLKHLRLECGGDTPVPGLGKALSCLTRLESLVLWKYAPTSTFTDNLSDLQQLHHVCVYPVGASGQVAETNTNTLTAVKKLSQLKTLDWVFQEDHSSTIILSDTENHDNNDQWIPFKPLTSDSDNLTNNTDNPIEYTSVKQLKEKHLEPALPNTKINVYCAANDKHL